MTLKELEQAVESAGGRVKSYQNYNPDGQPLEEYQTCCITTLGVIYYDQLTKEAVFNHEIFQFPELLEAYLDNK